MKKSYFFAKKSTFFFAKKKYSLHPLYTIGSRKRPAEQSNGHLQENRGYSVQSYLRTWGRYDVIASGLSKAKKVGYVGVA